MQLKVLLRWLLSVVGIVSVTLSLIIFAFLTLDIPVQGFYMAPVLQASQAAQDPLSIKSTTTAKIGLPIRLRIPKINVDAAIEYVGLTPGGAVGVPKGPSNAAWFDVSPRPGDNGSSIITGHFGPWKNGSKSVFDNLDKLKKGDNLYIEDEKGIITTFVVRGFNIYDPATRAKDVFISSDGKAHLNLITCEGIWDKTYKTYSNRLVVFTDKK